jgi:Fic family protein
LNPRSFGVGAPGRLVTIQEGGHAFIPSPLPLPLRDALTPQVLLALSEADNELGRLDGLGSNLPNPELLIAPFLRREALLSSRIEGTQTTFSDFVLFEAAEEELASADNREVANYVEALKYGVQRVSEIPLGRQLILEIHQHLMRGTDERQTLPGALRDRQVFIAPARATIDRARYVPPPPLALPTAVENLATYLQQPEAQPLLIRLAVSHYQFEAVHPFVDGNGRVGRILIALQLCSERRLAAPMLYLSAYFERHRQQYYDHLLRVSQTGSWEPWLLFFLRGVALQARDAISRTRELHALRDLYRTRVSGARRSTALLTLVDDLFRLPVMTNRLARLSLGFSWQAANENIQRLVDANILTLLGVGGAGRHIFTAREIIEILDRVEAEDANSVEAGDANPVESGDGAQAVTSSA